MIYYTPVSVLMNLWSDYTMALLNPPFREPLQRGQRVLVRYADTWPQCVCWPNGRTGTVLETVGNKAIILLDEFVTQTTTIELSDLEVINETRS